MSFIKVSIEGQDVSKLAQQINQLNEYNDESNQFGGVFRRGNLTIEFDNNSQALDAFQSFFYTGRNHKKITLFYRANDPGLDDYLIFEGVIDEGTTETDIKRRIVSLSILDYLVLLNDYTFEKSDAKDIDDRYYRLRGSRDIQVNKHFIACFLYHYLSKDSFRLNKILNVFKGNSQENYPTINAEIESIFPPADSYYGQVTAQPLEVLTTLCRSINSYAAVENNVAESVLHIRNRPVTGTTFWSIPPLDIMDINKRTTGFNKLYNSIIINNTDPFKRQSSIEKYGVRALEVTSYAPPSQALANSYLDYYSEPKEELECSVRMNHITLSPRVGDIVQIMETGRVDKTKQGINKKYGILSRSIDFMSEIINFRLREV